MLQRLPMHHAHGLGPHGMEAGRWQLLPDEYLSLYQCEVCGRLEARYQCEDTLQRQARGLVSMPLRCARCACRRVRDRERKERRLCR